MVAKAVRFYVLGDRAVVMESPPPVELDCQKKLWWLAQQLSKNSVVTDVIPGMNNLTVVLDPLLVCPEGFLPQLEIIWLQSGKAQPASREIHIPVEYGGVAGPDLEFVAQKSGLTTSEVISMHSGMEYIVYFIGFQPGFAYLAGLPEKLFIPRRAEPRLSVPAGSVGIGGSQTGIYPSETPGGWHLIGKTQLCLFNPLDPIPTLLQPGDRVRFFPEN
jgi:5-oxoprolinase (ATP-hydrolysing) subunit B